MEKWLGELGIKHLMPSEQQKKKKKRKKEKKHKTIYVCVKALSSSKGVLFLLFLFS